MVVTQAHRRARTAVFTGPSQVELREEPLREPGPEDVIVRTLFSGISAGTEMNVFRGSAPQWRTRRDPTTKLFFETTSPDWSYPLAYGYAAVGKVERLGDAAASLGAPPVGALVFTYSPHASFYVVSSE